MRVGSSVGQMRRVKIEDLKPTQVRKFDASPKLLGQNNILFETLDLGPFLVRKLQA